MNAENRRHTLCPAELGRRGQGADGFEEEKMAFERSVVSAVAMTPGKPPQRRPLAGPRGRERRFPGKICDDDLRFRDVLWRSAVFSMYSAEERRWFTGGGGDRGRRFRGGDGNLGLGFMSLDYRVVEAEYATSADRIGGGLGPEQKVAWEMFGPLQRVLIVSVAAAAAVNSKHGDEIKRLRRNVEDRDQALDVMRRKLNDLWERIFFLQDQSGSMEKNKDIDDGFREHEDGMSISGVSNTSSWEPCEKGSERGLRNWKTAKSEMVSLDSPHAPCAAAILELKRRTESILEKEASNVMAAFASVLEKVEGFESNEKAQTHEGTQKNAEGFALGDLKLSVEQASAQITSLQLSLFDIWHTLLPEALCAVNISPSELDHYLDKAKKESSVAFPERQFDSQAWKQWLDMEEHAFEANIFPNFQDQSFEDGYFYKMPLGASEQEERRLSDMSDWSSTITGISDHNNIWASVEADAASAIVAAVKKTVDKIIAPLDAQKSGSSDGAQDMVVEKLLSELETAATKVANMESELGKLKEYVKVCDKKRKDAEEKLAEAVKQGIQNQAEASLELVELVEKLQLGDHASVDLIHSRKLNFAAKEEEIARLQKDCKQKDDIIKEMTLAAQMSKDASNKKLTTLEDVCKKKNTTIKRLKEEVICLEEKVSQLMKLKIPPSLIWNNEPSIPPVMSTNFLFDMDMPSSPESNDNQNSPDLGADESTSSSSRGYNVTGHRPLVQSVATSPITGRVRSISPTPVRFTRESCGNSRNLSPTTTRLRDVSSTGNSRSTSPTAVRFKGVSGNSRSGRHSSKVNAGQSSSTRGRLVRTTSEVRFMNENTRSSFSSLPKIKSSRSGGVLSGVDTNLNSKSRGSTPETEEVQRNARNNQTNKPKDVAARKRWM